jgi:predicted O-methyltransferase YrrM
MTEEDCYRFMAREIRDGFRTLETGAGVSTVLFAAWNCDHLAVVPDADEATAIENYCDGQGIPRCSLAFDIRPSEIALPTLARSALFDLVFIDGCHGFPSPIIDWFYGAGLLRKGGVVVFDDIQLPQVGWFLKTFIESDQRWETVARTSKWAAFRRLSDGPLGEEWFDQPFFPTPPLGVMRRTKDLVPLSIKKRVRAFV